METYITGSPVGPSNMASGMTLMQHKLNTKTGK